MAEDKILEMRKAVDLLNRAADAYYNGQAEIMTDYEWDALFDRLKVLEQETGVILEESPIHHVSADSITGQKEEHEFAALSLAKTKKTEDLTKWADGKPIWISWKLDGLTLVATYDKGKLTKVVTRGDGHFGTNITHLAPAIQGIPQKIKNKGHIVVRGECVISYADFNQFLIESGEDYANPRNLASGSLTLKDIDEVKSRHLQWIPFTLVYTDENINSWGKRMAFLEDNGMKTVKHECILTPNLDNIQKVIDRWTEEVTKNKNPFPVDGLVIAYEDYEYSQTGSITGHHATRAGYAFKWKDESATSKLDHIEWSCAASTISPVAVFEPVELEGTTVQRASLCNISECERLGIGDKDSVLSVIKANKIIPKVIQVQQKVGELHIPETCPVCHSQTQIVTSIASGTRTLHCSNPKCPAKQLKKFARFVSKDGLDIDGISEQTLSRFINMGWIKEYADIFRLSAHLNQIATLEGFGKKSANNIHKAIEKSRNAEAHKLLYALCIPLVGKDVCNRLLKSYPLEKLAAIASGNPNINKPIVTEKEDDYELDLFAQHEQENLLSNTTEGTTDANTFTPLSIDTRIAIFAGIDGLGPEKSASVVKWFSDEENQNEYRNLLGLLHLSQDDNNPLGQKCEGLTFVITGDVHHYKNRNELKAYIESQGGKVTGSVSKSTSYLINNDVTSTSGKNQKAHQLNIPIISEDQFIEKFG
ncbi:NAD-dependent DNA ligase LigA [Segatella bryantii]|uniref:DNA ligase n=1 Tax=Segatella bryantii TaxID=77095 RepID=A0ABX4EQ87_SEGBR|nr:NAD-dependent DNA ligase LigA [Segatella bryantii]MDR4929910.1 NAD-dependent DNA ligase LigA [Segatella bryantii]OYP57374.1 DNA ligase (NAD(+)) LigA [Segatella bryantii]UKK80249.1 NAD-dependent DNA ligase LigA [Segatella bryantii]